MENKLLQLVLWQAELIAVLAAALQEQAGHLDAQDVELEEVGEALLDLSALLKSLAPSVRSLKELF